jgi:predicted DCC family thiol-disulfide oxidoreductase YuxK
MTPQERAQIEGHPIILYDGVCALCNGVVRYLLARDRADRFRFIPQDTPLANELLAPYASQPAAEGVILLTAALNPTQQIYRRTEAVAEALHLLNSPLAFLVRFVPRPIRELAYSFIARYRYRLFGRYETCPIPTSDQRSRILGTPS